MEMEQAKSVEDSHRLFSSLLQAGKLTKVEELCYNWQYRRIGGGFCSALFAAIVAADASNRRLLAKGFPDEVAAVDQFGNGDLGQRLRSKGLWI